MRVQRRKLSYEKREPKRESKKEAPWFESPKQSAIAYIRMSINVKAAHGAAKRALHECDLELGLPGDPTNLRAAAAMNICVERLTEVLAVLESAP